MGRERDPIGEQQWQDAVNGAHVLLLIDAARQYGLITGGPKINAERCRDILALGAARGYQPGDQLGAQP